MRILGLEKKKHYVKVAKIPHLRINKPKIAVVGSAVAKTGKVGDTLQGPVVSAQRESVGKPDVPGISAYYKDFD